MLRGNKVYGSDAIKRKYQQEKYFKVGKLKVQLKGEEKVGNWFDDYPSKNYLSISMKDNKKLIDKWYLTIIFTNYPTNS